MELPRDMYEFKRAFEHRLILRKLKPNGIGSIIFGVIGLFIGISGLADSFLNVFLAGLALFLIIEGIWLLKAPSPAAFIADGCALILLGVWNLFVSFAGGRMGGFTILGVFQIIWGINSFKDSKRAAEAISVTTTKEDIQKADEILDSIFKSNFKNNEQYIEFTQNDFSTSQMWRGVMIDGHVILIGQRYYNGIIAPKEEIVINLKGKYTPGKPMNGKIPVNGKEMSVLIPAMSLQRLQMWKPDVVRIPDTI